MSFEIAVILNMAHKVLNDNLFNIYEIHNLKVYHRQISKQKIFKYNLQHLHFFHKSRLLSAFFCKGSIIHNDNFFHTYAFHTLTVFNISFHIEKLIFIHYILLFFRFYHSYILQLTPKINRAYIYRYGIIEGTNEDNIVLFFSGIVFRMNVAKDLYQARGS